jgi:simple sugar transport system ATP-binding protein
MGKVVPSTDSRSPLLSLRSLSKSFNGLAALNSINLDLYPGEILGLMGDNGAGKSTLIKILSGVHAPDSGELLIHGKQVNFERYNVANARRLGIETVFQDNSFGEEQPLWRNIFVGRPLTNRFGFIKVKEQKRATMDILRHQVGLRSHAINANSCTQSLSGGERQGLAIGRAMNFDADIIILDEPTTALSLHEVDKVLDFVSQIAQSNKACIYISHNMSHVYRVTTRVILLDRGILHSEYTTRNLSPEELGSKLMGMHNEAPV